MYSTIPQPYNACAAPQPAAALRTRKHSCPGDRVMDEPLQGRQKVKRFLIWTCTWLQGFNWECAHRKEPAWYRVLASRAPEMKAAGITAVWLPPTQRICQH